MKTVIGRQQLPNAEFDGFYYALITKNNKKNVENRNS